MKKYENLFSPLKIGSITVKNRYAVGPMGGRFFIYDDKGQYSLNGIDYWVERARGGFGLIVTGSNVANLTVDPFDPINGNPNPVYARTVFSHGARETLERVHDYGGKMFMQISMGPGRMRNGKSCSPIPRYKAPDELTEELTREEIELKIGDIRGIANAGVDPRYMGLGPIAATERLLRQTGISLADIRLIELNEAFASQSIACIRALKLEERMDIINVNGGAIALGHPIGSSGSRIIVTLLHEMARRKLELGLATLCVAGGMGMAALIEMN